jgi:hypothetical protein
MDNYEELHLNQENQQWLKILCSSPENEKIFREEYMDVENAMMSVLSFRKRLLETSRYRKVTSSELEETLRCKDINKKLKILSEMFLEPVSLGEMNYIDSVEISADDIIQLHNNHRELRLASILASWKILLEQDLRLKKVV